MIASQRLRHFIVQAAQFLLALLIVFAIRSSFFEPFKIPSGSMLPTLYVGDFIFVNKFAYSFHLPLSEYFGAKQTLVERAPPRHGDVVVFEYPGDRSVHYIKRVIGTPGDLIEMREKIVYVNGKPLRESQASPEEVTKKLKDIGDPRYERATMAMAREEVEGREHLMLTDGANSSNGAFGPVRVPKESLFVMGDNRDFSNDSRFWGFVPYENVTGRAETVWLSLWINPAQASENAFHPERIGTRLH
jgi:signal peptidase I